MNYISKSLNKAKKACLWMMILSAILFGALILSTPNVEFLKTKHPRVSSFMLEDKLVRKNKRIRFVPLSQISAHMIHAALAAEDDLFFVHNGINWQAVKNAAYRNFRLGRYKSGGSTITQQLARNLFLSKNKSIIRKLRELFITYKLESTLSKKRILELYLNYVELGPGVYGIKSGSYYHFKTSPHLLHKSQAALLAAVLPNPKVYGRKPYSNKTKAKQNRVLYRMSRYDLNLPRSIPSNRRYTAPKSSISNNKRTAVLKKKPSRTAPKQTPKPVTTKNQVFTDFSDFKDD